MEELLSIQEVNAILDSIPDEPHYCNVVIHTSMLGDIIAALPYIKGYAETTNVHIYFSYDKQVASRFLNFIEPEPWFSLRDTPHPDYPIKVVGVSDMARQLGIGGAIHNQFGWFKPHPIRFKAMPRLEGLSNHPRYALLSPFASQRIKEMPYQDWNHVVTTLLSHHITPVVLGARGSDDHHWQGCVYPNTWERPMGLLSLIQHGMFHIGLSSGNSWLAHMNGLPTIKVNGYCNEDLEFTPTFQVAKGGCRNCWNRSLRPVCDKDYQCMQGHAETLAERTKWLIRMHDHKEVPCQLFGESDLSLIHWRDWLEQTYSYRLNVSLFQIAPGVVDVAAMTHYMQKSNNAEFDNATHHRMTNISLQQFLE